MTKPIGQRGKKDPSKPNEVKVLGEGTGVGPWTPVITPPFANKSGVTTKNPP